MYQGSVEGNVLAQVAHVIGAGGADEGWMVWLFHEQRELLDRYPTAEEAMAAAEAVLDRRDESRH
jgi:hypothetical protein